MIPKKISQKVHGFTLTELAIVIVIISLLIGGITVGKKLIQNANLNKLMQETTKFRTAFQSFKTIHNFAPGDYPNAYRFWGSQASCTDADVNSTSSGCNGDGNGIIAWSAESYRANQHLGLAKLTNATYNGTSEVIISSYENYKYTPPLSCNTAGRSNFGKNCHIVGNGTNIEGAGLTPEQLEKIDFKLDDGIPVTGRLGFKLVTGTVTEATCGDSNGYLSSTNIGCNLIYNLD